MNSSIKKKILVTGGFGYIGTCLIDLLLKKNYKVFVVDNLVNGQKFSKTNLTYFKGDYSSKQIVKIITNNDIKIIIHLAAFIDAEESTKDPKKYFQNNVIKFQKFLENIKKLNIDKIIYASSAAVYGNGGEGKLKETCKTHPISPYGLTKLQGEKLLNYYSKKNNFQSYSLRFFNIAGANYKINCGPWNKGYKHIYNTLLRSKKFIINGTNYKTKDGTCVRDFVNVNDIANIIYKLLKNKLHASKNTILNCGSGNGASVKEIAYAYKEKIDNNLQITNGPRRSGDPSSIIANNYKLKKIIKFNFKKSKLQNILNEYNDWKNLSK
jgi:UDP-glucose 4-epimerase